LNIQVKDGKEGVTWSHQNNSANVHEEGNLFDAIIAGAVSGMILGSLPGGVVFLCYSIA
jgi:hypothetical protein